MPPTTTEATGCCSNRPTASAVLTQKGSGNTSAGGVADYNDGTYDFLPSDPNP